MNIKYFGLNDGSKLGKEIDKNDIIINCIHDFGNQKFNLKLLETICNAAAGTKRKCCISVPFLRISRLQIKK